MVLGTKKLQYLDLTNYLAAGTSLDKFYKAYEVESPKGYFPYEFFDSLDKLDYPGLPPKEAFYSTLTKKSISDQEYETCLNVFKRENMKTFRDYVRYYNNHDVIGLVQGIEKMMAVNINNKIDMFKDAVSLPGLAQKRLFRSLDSDDYFTNFSSDHAYIYKQLKAGIVGGPSIVFCRYQEKGKTLIKNKNVCQRVVGYDASSLYLDCTGKGMPTGRYTLREKIDNFKKHTEYSNQAIKWLEYMSQKDNIHIRHAENNVHGEKRLKNFDVDGFCEETQTVYEFLGCYYHGHCKHYNEKKWIETEQRLTKLRDMGYNVISITGCEWEKMNTRMDVENSPLTCTDIENGILSGECFGIVKCDLHVPEDKIPDFSEFPVIFKNTEITMADIGDHMQAYARSIQRRKGVERSLISSMHGEGMVILTPLFKKYMEMGLVCTNIEWILEYHEKPVFEWFWDEVINDRRMGDLDPDNKTKAETSKTEGNTRYFMRNIFIRNTT